METLPSDILLKAIREVAIGYAETIGYSLDQPHALCRMMILVLLDKELKALAYARALPPKIIQD